MPAQVETLALPAPPIGGLKDATPSTMEVDKPVATEKVAPAPIATHTRSIGMIHPPTDIRNIIAKTADFVARNGPEFEKRILATNKGNVKFNFLIPTDPYHPYYLHMVGEKRAQLNGTSLAPIIAGPPGALGSFSDPTGLDKQAPEKPPAPPAKRLVEPEKEQYTVRLPDLLSGLDLDIIKLTAQFVARNGKNFLTDLTKREHANYQFHFLKPTHSLFTLFTSLADAYSKVLMPTKGLADRLRLDSSNRSHALERAMARFEWEKSQERARQQAEDAIEAERTAMQLIDWHDFVVVETIDFTDEEESGLPLPQSLEEVIRRSKQMAENEELAEADAKAVAKAEGLSEVPKETAPEMDAEEMQMVQDGLRSTTLGPAADDSGGPPPPPPPPQTSLADQNGDDMEQDMEEDEAPMRIVRNYKRPEERAAAIDPTKVVVSPITGELIPVTEMAEHMRISLIDPKYKEQKERMMAKLRENTLASDDEISRNMMALAKTRPDIFGTTEEEISNAVTAEITEARQGKGADGSVPWDGHSGASVNRPAAQSINATMTLEEQIAAIQRDRIAAAAAEGKSLAGPMALPRFTPVAGKPLPPPPSLNVNILRPAGLSASPTIPIPSIRPPTLAPPNMAHMQAMMRPPPPLFGQQMLAGMGMGVGMGFPQPGQQYGMGQQPVVQSGPPVPLRMVAPSLAAMLQQQQQQQQPPPVSRMEEAAPPPIPPPPPPEEPELKRQKVDEVVLVPEAEFLARHPGPVRILVALPVVEGEASLNGQSVEVTVASISETTGQLKEVIAAQIGLPANKQKLNGKAGFFKDSITLAHYNVGPGDVVTLGLRERGGRKK